jgi:hypothetical protein
LPPLWLRRIDDCSYISKNCSLNGDDEPAVNLLPEVNDETRATLLLAFHGLSVSRQGFRRKRI